MLFINGKWIPDAEHEKNPGPPFHRTPRGWSDSQQKGSPGEHSLLKLDESLAEVFQDSSFRVVRQEKISAFVGEPDEVQRQFIENTPPEVLTKALEYQRHLMRIDAAIYDPAKKVFPYPIFIETDGSQHESNHAPKKGQSSLSHKDRIKDFCGRLNHEAVVLRFSSTEEANDKAMLVVNALSRLSRYAPSKIQEDEALYRSYAQKYADAICYDLAGRTYEEVKADSNDSDIDAYIGRIQEQVLRDIDNPRLGREKRKLLSLWARDRKAVKWLCGTLRSYARDKDYVAFARYRKNYYYAYQFLEGIESSAGKVRKSDPKQAGIPPGS